MAESGEQAGSYFLSYSRSDEAFALKLAHDIRANGVSMWVDQLDIRPSEHWDRAIERAVRDCRGIVVVLSPRSVVSDNVADEISFAIDSGKTVLPVMIERCTLPLRITRMQVIDATGNYQKALQQCLAELCRDERSTDRHAPVASERMLDPELLRTAKARLAALIGPIAGVLVDKAASRSNSAKQLYQLLADHIPDSAAREQFLGTAASKAGPAPIQEKPARTATRLPTGDTDAIAKVLMRYVGPIAPKLVEREGSACASVEELRQRLASFIPKEAERKEFLREAQTK